MIVAVLIAMLLSVTYHHCSFLDRRSKRRTRTWDDLIGDLIIIDESLLRNVAELGGNLADVSCTAADKRAAWKMIGGADGIAKLARNAEAMLELAVYAERWNEQHGPVFSEMIRGDAFYLQRLVWRLRLNAFLSREDARLNVGLRDAVAAYCLTRDRLLAIYETAHAGLVPRLRTLV